MAEWFAWNESTDSWFFLSILADYLCGVAGPQVGEKPRRGTSPPADSDPLKWEASSKECRANVSSQARPSFHVGHDLVRPAVVVVYTNDSWVVEKVRAADMAWGEAAGLLSV